MNWLQRLVLSTYFAYLAVFLIVFCIAALLLLKPSHPVFRFSIICGIVIFILQRYRKSIVTHK